MKIVFLSSEMIDTVIFIVIQIQYHYRTKSYKILLPRFTVKCTEKGKALIIR